MIWSALLDGRGHKVSDIVFLDIINNACENGLIPFLRLRRSPVHADIYTCELTASAARYHLGLMPRTAYHPPHCFRGPLAQSGRAADS